MQAEPNDWIRTAVAASVLFAALALPARAHGDLLVSSRFTDNVLRYDAHTGAFKGVFAAGNGLDNPNGIAYGPDERLYVGLGDVARVLRFQQVLQEAGIACTVRVERGMAIAAACGQLAGVPAVQPILS